MANNIKCLRKIYQQTSYICVIFKHETIINYVVQAAIVDSMSLSATTHLLPSSTKHSGNLSEAGLSTEHLISFSSHVNNDKQEAQL